MPKNNFKKDGKKFSKKGKFSKSTTDDTKKKKFFGSKGNKLGNKKYSTGKKSENGATKKIDKNRNFDSKKFISQKTCFNCRKPGHKISECPDKKSETGICFNCGSQEHILRACPQPLVDGGASYATCFICKQKGHLSSKCPKSSHGLYPNGGSCLKCGKVDHLLKDCPLKKKDQEANTVQNSDSLDDSQYIVEPVSKKKRKSNKTTNMSTAERDQPLKKMDNVQTGEKKPKEKVIMFKKK